MQVQTAPPKPRNGEPNYANRAGVVIDKMTALAARLNSPWGGFEYVRAGRWQHVATGHHVETGYSYGEGRVRVFLDGGRTADADHVISGRDDDLAEFHALFPVSSS